MNFHWVPDNGRIQTENGLVNIQKFLNWILRLLCTNTLHLIWLKMDCVCQEKQTEKDYLCKRCVHVQICHIFYFSFSLFCDDVRQNLKVEVCGCNVIEWESLSTSIKLCLHSTNYIQYILVCTANFWKQNCFKIMNF